MQHKPEYCSLVCKREATRWYEYNSKTVYLCEEHAERFSPNDDFIIIKGKEVELAIYSCSPDCKVCNQ